jgi:mono/diheme cytochrome c family protein/DNA-binding beta-propeller fold protein YncE
VGEPLVGATLALARAGERELAYVADEDERALRTVDLATGAEIAFTPLDAAPGQLLVLADGRVVVALRGASSLLALEPAADAAAPLAVLCAVDVPTEPFGLALTPDRARVLVTSRWGHALTGYDAASLERVLAVDLGRDPAGVVTSADGTRAFVSHVVGSRLSIVDLTSAAAPRARAVDLHQVEGAALGGARAPRWSTVQGYALVRTAAGRVLSPGVLANPARDPDAPPSGGYGGGGGPREIGDVAVLDEETERLSVTPVFSVVDHAVCMLPRAAALDEARGHLLVACQGEGVRVYDARARLPHQAPVRRFEVAEGPTGIVVDGPRSRGYVWSQPARTLSVLALDVPAVSGDDLWSGKHSGSPRPLRALAMPRHRADDDPRLALGRRIFHGPGDGRVAGDHRVCASCHPDGRDDGLTWSTPEGPRQTPILAGRLGDTAPYSWDGSNADLEGHVRRTMRRLSGAGMAQPDLDALLAYVRRLEVPAARAAREALAARGEALFTSAETGCSTCHAGATTADGLRHDVASAVKGERSPAFDTPSLRFLGQSAPYFHDGRYATLADLLRGVDGTMGHTSHLGADDLRALTAYLEAL